MPLRSSTNRADAALACTVLIRSNSVSRRTRMMRGASTGMARAAALLPVRQRLRERVADHRHGVGPEIERADLGMREPTPDRIGDHRDRRHCLRDLGALALAAQLHGVDL